MVKYDNAGKELSIQRNLFLGRTFPLKCYYDEKISSRFSSHFQSNKMNTRQAKFFVVISRGRLFILSPLFSHLTIHHYMVRVSFQGSGSMRNDRIKYRISSIQNKNFRNVKKKEK